MVLLVASEGSNSLLPTRLLVYPNYREERLGTVISRQRQRQSIRMRLLRTYPDLREEPALGETSRPLIRLWFEKHYVAHLVVCRIGRI
jgi:hypothetical protein